MQFAISCPPLLGVRAHFGAAVFTLVCTFALPVGTSADDRGAPTAACCLPDGSCAEWTQQQCTDAGGTWHSGSDCSATGACSIGGDCIVTTEECCDDVGGTFDSNGSCDDTGCAITQQTQAAKLVRAGVPSIEAVLKRIQAAGPNRGTPQVFLDGNNTLQVIGTPGVDTIRLRRGNNPARLRVLIPEDGTGLDILFEISDITSIHIATDADDDLVVFDDSNGSIAAIAPFSVDTGDGDDIIITRTGSLTLAQVLSLITTLDSARNLAIQADAVAQLAGAISNTGGGSGDLISEANLLAQAAANTLVLPVESYLTDLTNQLIIPAANAVPDAQAQVIEPALNLIKQAYVDIIEVAQQLEADVEAELVAKANELIAFAETEMEAAANSLEGCGLDVLLNESAAFQQDMDALMAQIEIIADLCPEKGPEPPEQPDGCPEIQELVDCAEKRMEEFMLRVEICEDLGDDMVDMGDEFADRAMNELELPGDQYLAAFDNLATTADGFVSTAEAYEAAAEAWIAQLETQLETTADGFDQRAQTDFIDAGAALEAQADANLGTLADQIAQQAAQMSEDAEAVILAATMLLDGPSRGSANGDCSQIQTTNTILGGPGANFLLGTAGDDLIDGKGGPDLIVGGPGDDMLIGGDGTDLIFGGSGTNEIHGNERLDVLIGGNDVDCIYGEEGIDVILGRGGNDKLDGGDYIDVILGGDGDDEAWGRNGIDVLLGGDGADMLDGGNCIDVILGQLGDDTIIGGDGQVLTIGSVSIDLGDVLFGGDGDDAIFGDAQSRQGTGIDVVFGGDGDDKIYVADGGDLVVGSNFTLKLGNVVFGGAGSDEIESKKGIDVLFGQDDDDAISADEGANITFSNGNFLLEMGDILFGGDGNDTINSDSEDGTQDVDLVFAGAGDDTVRAYDGGEITIGSNFTFMLGNLVFGRSGDDTITTGAGLDVIFGGMENDTVSAGDGAELEIGQNFSIKLGDLIFGGPGNDVLHADVPDFNDGVGSDGIDIIFGGPGDDRIYGAGGGLVDFGSVDFLFGNLMFGGPGDDIILGDYQTFDAGNREKGIDLIFGGDGDDTIDAAPGDDITIGQIPNVFFVNLGNIVFGGPGNDTITTEIGLDLVFCGRGDDNATTGLGIDFIFGSQDDDTISAGDGGLILIPVGASVPIPLGNFVFGGDGNDDITSEGLPTEIDLLFGNKCDDVIRAGNGLIDLVFGNLGNDEIHGEPGINLLFGNRGDDLIFGADDLLSLDLIFGNRGKDTIHAGDGLIDLVFGGDDADVINGNAGIDLIFGNEGADIIHGDGGIDLIFGNRGGDDIYGDDGLDLLFGNRGRDCIHGGSGLDLIFGGDDDDLIFGDSGLTLAFGNGGNDEMYGGGDLDLLFGNSGNDRIDGGGGIDLIFGNTGADVIFGGSGLNLIFGGSAADYIFGGGDLDLVFGGAGNDVIRGAGNTDLLFGNADNDTLFGDSGGDLIFGNDNDDQLDGGSERDLIFGNRGADKILLGSGNDFAFGNRDNDDLRAGVSDGNKDFLFGNRGDDCLDRCENNDKRLGGPGVDCKTADCSTFNFGGATACGEIRGKVKLDTNGDTNGDEPIPGVTVYIDSNGNGALDGGELSTVTLTDDPDTHEDEAGCYRFTGISAGSYQIRQIVPSGLTQVSPSGAAGATVGTCAIATANDLVNRNPCAPDPALPNPCENCDCPPGFMPKPVVTMHFECSYDGSPCTTDEDCDCGGTCDEVIEIVECQCVPIDACPPGSINENEPECGPSTLNHGCDFPFPQVPPAFTTIQCGETACGTIRAIGGLPHDTDWWLLPPMGMGCQAVTICVEAEFFGQVQLGRFFACPPFLLAEFVFPPGQRVCQTFFLDATTYSLRIATLEVPLECANYTLEISCAPCAANGPDTGDAGNDGVNSSGADGRSERRENANRLDEAFDVDLLDDFDAATEEFELLHRGSNPPNALLTPPPPHNARKNRYVSFDPNGNGPGVAIEVIIPPCRRGWVGPPQQVSFNGMDTAWVSEVVADPVYRTWNEDVVHVRGCPIAPERQYDLTPVRLDGPRGDTLSILTATVWGDIVGPLNASGMYLPPDGVVDGMDVLAVFDKINGNPRAPHTTWVDIAPLEVDYFIDNGDLSAAQDALLGAMFPPPVFGIENIVECELPLACSGPCADSNCDGIVTPGDIAPFVAALTGGVDGWVNWHKTNLGNAPSCDYFCANDTDANAVVTPGDIANFVQALTTGSCTGGN